MKTTVDARPPLSDITVIEIAGAPGSWATGLLGEFGARVIKIGRMGMPPVRWGSFGMRYLNSQDERTRYAAFNPHDRNKESIILDLKKESGRQVFYKLVAAGDVVVEGYRPGVARRLKIDYETLLSINPGIIYCAITGYGQDGPYQDTAGHDINYAALSGVLGLTALKGGPPVLPGIPVGDWGGGFAQAVIGILLALTARRPTGRGQYIDISMTDGLVSFLKGYVADYLETGIAPAPGESVPTGGAPYNNVYRTKDEKYVSIGCWEPWLYENLCRAISREDLIPLQHARGDDRDRVHSILSGIFLTRTRDEWFQFLKDKDVCVAPVNSLAETLADEQVLHRRMVVEVGHPRMGKVKQIGIGIKLSETPGTIRRTAPMEGENTDSILKELGYSSQQIDQLRQEKAIE
ncbi:MAG: CoA transferase [Chloroflexi bacterium]|nr:CoA transferase [Chloroflexota bacterium]